METQFYEDSNPWLNSKKKSMTLDLDTSKTRKSILSTPDVQMLKLASPELEKMIINQQGNVCTTPTPTQFICPKNVTDEQAAFAQGFVEALQSLHSTIPGMPGATPVSLPANLTTDSQTEQTYTQVSVVQTLPQMQAPPNTVVTSAPAYFNPALHTTTSLPGTTVNYQRNSAIASTADATALHQNGAWVTTSRLPNSIKQEHSVMQVIEQPQTVPVFHGTPPMSPIDMESQERIKAERKKLRNRVAASKCRKRKLERIARLEDKVKDLKTHNSDLQNTATKLREQVCALKQGVMEHVKNGCQVMLAQQLAF